MMRACQAEQNELLFFALTLCEVQIKSFSVQSMPKTMEKLLQTRHGLFPQGGDNLGGDRDL